MRSQSPYILPNQRRNPGWLNRLQRQLLGIPPVVWILGFVGIASVMFISACLFLALLAIGSTYASGNILSGVTVNGYGFNSVDVGGLSPADAAAKLKNIVPEGKIVLSDENRTWEVSTADLGITVDGDATAQKAVEVGRSDSSVVDSISIMTKGAEVAPIYTIDLTRAGETLKALADKVNVKQSVSKPGRVLNVDATLDTLPPDVLSLLERGQLPLVMNVIEGPRTEYVVQRGEELGIISKKFNVSMQDIIDLNDLSNPDVIYPGQTLLIPAAGIWQPTEAEAPPAPLAKGKAIVVLLSAQRIYAYENGHLVHSTLMSSGNPGHETVLGDYKIYVKYVTDRMVGPDYDIPDVPWTMYFYKGYGIHGAYWHNTFGRTRSHGCVNLSTDEAKWFFDFAQVGTLVRVLQDWNPA